MIRSSRYKKLFGSPEGVIGYVPMKGGVGDQLTEFATLSLLRQWKMPFEIINSQRLYQSNRLPKRITRLYISGGGNMGSLYAECQSLRFRASQMGLPVTVLPQSFTDPHEDVDLYDTVWVRERASLAICPSARLAPDLAMSARLPARSEAIVRKCGVYLRQDTEALFPEQRSNIGDPERLSTNLAAYLDLIAPFERIVTDRLHFAIAAMLMQRQATLLPNSYNKNRSMWETWLGELGCGWAGHPDELPACRRKRVSNNLPVAGDLSKRSPRSMPPEGLARPPMEIRTCRPLEFNDDVYVFADILLDGDAKAVWFRVDKRNRRFLNDLADPFLLAFLQLAMRKNRSLWIRNAGVSAGLLRNLQQFQRVWSLWHKEYSEVEVYADSISNVEGKRARGEGRAIASFSGGVDSTFTLFNHTQNKLNRYKHNLSHAMLVHGFDIPVNDQASFESVRQQCKQVANDAGLKLLVVATNIRDFDFDWEQGHVSAIAACMHLLSGGFRTGLVPSTLNYGVLYPWGSTPLTDPLHSSNDFRVETDGADYTRVDKLRLIRKWATGVENLRFCWVAEPYDYNCGRCAKCTMTAIMLLIAQASKKSIQPFPQSKRIERQLETFVVSRLDRSDLRNDLDRLKSMQHKPGWLEKLLIKLEHE